MPLVDKRLVLRSLDEGFNPNLLPLPLAVHLVRLVAPVAAYGKPVRPLDLAFALVLGGLSGASQLEHRHLFDLLPRRSALPRWSGGSLGTAHHDILLRQSPHRLEHRDHACIDRLFQDHLVAEWYVANVRERERRATDEPAHPDFRRLPVRHLEDAG